MLLPGIQHRHRIRRGTASAKLLYTPRYYACRAHSRLWILSQVCYYQGYSIGTASVGARHQQSYSIHRDITLAVPLLQRITNYELLLVRLPWDNQKVNESTEVEEVAKKFIEANYYNPSVPGIGSLKC